jgi:hypothetical protein
MHGGEEKYTGVWWQNQKGRDYFEDLSVGGRIIFKWMLKQ